MKIIYSGETEPTIVIEKKEEVVVVQRIIDVLMEQFEGAGLNEDTLTTIEDVLSSVFDFEGYGTIVIDPKMLKEALSIQKVKR